MNPEEIKRIIEDTPDIDWYEKFEAVPGSGVFTPGWNDRTDGYTGRFTFLEMDESDFRNKRILEIGCYSGSWTFLMEEMGAEVTAIDPYDPTKTGFALVHSLRKSKIEHFQISVYEISPELLGTFDIISFYGVFYHLKHPLFAFEALASCLKEDGLMIGAGTTCQNWFHNADPSCAIGVNLDAVNKDNFKGDENDFTIAKLHGLPIAAYAEKQFLRDHTNWFMPNQILLKRWLEDTGMHVEKIRTFTSELKRDWNKIGIKRSSTAFKAFKKDKPRPEYTNPNMIPYQIKAALTTEELKKRKRL